MQILPQHGQKKGLSVLTDEQYNIVRYLCKGRNNVGMLNIYLTLNHEGTMIHVIEINQGLELLHAAAALSSYTTASFCYQLNDPVMSCFFLITWI